MIRDSIVCSSRRGAALLALLAALAVPAAGVHGQSAGCNRARAIVDEVAGLTAGEHPDHASILQKLRTAQQLCPTLGDAWKFAYCSSLALGDQQNARIYKDRAIFNGVSAFDCGDAAPPAAAPLPSYVRDKFALVIGISEFRDKSITRLKYAARDAEAFAALLRDPRYGNFADDHVTVLTNGQATREAILNAVQKLFLRAGEEDLVVTYVSSHGSPGQQEEKGGLAGIGYFVTYDTDAQNIWLNAVDTNDFAEKISLIKARRKVTFLDTCYSGQAGKKKGQKALAIEGGGGMDDASAKRFLSGEGTFVVMSSGPAEQSWEDDSIQHSYFTFYLLEAFRRSKDPATLKDVFNYVLAKVPDAVAQQKLASQHPRMLPSTGPADLRIGVVPRGGSN